MKNIKRLLVILETLSKGEEVRFEDLKMSLQQHFGTFDKSNLSRDIQNLKNLGFSFSNNRGVYRLLELNKHNTTVFRFLKLYVDADLFKEISHTKSKNRDYIITHDFSKDIDYSTLTIILKAITSSKEVHITHKGYKSTSQNTSYVMQPYYIREFKSRWYVVGFVSDTLKVFSVDRINTICISQQSFTPSIHLKNDLLDIIATTYGVSYSLKEKPVIIQLKFAISQLQYLKSVPVSENQKITSENTSHFTIELFSYDTYELRQEILKYGSNVEILTPLSLRNWVQSEITKVTKLYV